MTRATRAAARAYVSLAARDLPRRSAPFGAAAVLELPAAEHDSLTAYPEDVDARRLDAG